MQEKSICKLPMCYLSLSSYIAFCYSVISTDALARGLDSPGLPYVISYDCPSNWTTHVHRSGRTGRAGKSGTSLTLVERQEARFFKRMVGEKHHMAKWGGRMGGGWAAWSEGEIGERIDAIAVEAKAKISGRPQ
jgi:superfamily II DNA/RNA helicase